MKNWILKKSLFYSKFLILLGLFLPLQTFSTQSVAIEKNEKQIIHPQFECYIDVHNLSLAEIKSHYPHDFVPNTQNIIHNPNATYWLAYKLSNYSTQKISRILNFNDPDLKSISLFENNAEVRKTGANFPFYKREITHKNFCFELNFKENETKTIFIAIKSDSKSTFTADISPISIFISYSLSEYFILGTFYGIIFILCIYNLILFLSDRDKTYLYYVFYLLSCALFAFNEDGLGFQFIWNKSPLINNFISYIAPITLLSSYLIYASSFIQARTHFPKQLKQNWLLFGAFLCYYILHFSLDWWNPLWFLAFMLPFLFMYRLGILYYKNNRHTSRYFIVGTTTILLSFIIYFLRLINVIPSGILPVYSFNFAFVIEAISLSMAVGAKVKQTIKLKEKAQTAVIKGLEENEKLKDKVNRELEGLVINRTQDLQEKTQQLELSNQKLLDLQQQLYKLNEHLDLKNYKLQKEVVNFSKERLTEKIISYEEFLKIYPSTHECYAFIAEIKWKNGFSCTKCNSKEAKQKDEFTKICMTCGLPQSLTSGTLFHALKFPITKALYIAYISNVDIGLYTIDKLSELLDINRNTCWSFRKKVVERNDSRKKELKKVKLKLEELI